MRTYFCFILTLFLFYKTSAQTNNGNIVGHWKYSDAKSYYDGIEEKPQCKKADLYVDEDGYFANEKKPKRPSETWKRWYDNRKWVKEDSIIKIIRIKDGKTIEKILIKKLTDNELTIQRQDGKRTVILSYIKAD